MKPAALMSLVLVAILGGCSESPTEYIADEFTVAQLTTQAGYAWFAPEKNSYQPDPNVLAQIQTRLDVLDSCYLFVNPSCTCNGTQKHFPHFVRCMEQAGFPVERIKIVSMRSASTKHHYMSRFNVHQLPTFFLDLKTGADRKIEPPDDPNARIEELIAQALSGQ